MAPWIPSIFCVILIGIIMLIIVPTLSYYLYRYFQLRNNPVIKKRHYMVVMVVNILFMTQLVGDKCLYMISIILTTNLQETQHHIARNIAAYFYFFISPAVALFVAFSCWLLYFDISWTKIANEHNKWTHFIDPNYNDKVQIGEIFAGNWFIKHHLTFGNPKWLTKFIIIPICFCITVSLCISFVLHSYIYTYVFMVWFILIALFTIVVYWNIPRQEVEVFKIKSQTDKFMQILFLIVVFFGIYIVLNNVFPNNYAIIISWQYFLSFCYFFGGLGSTKWVLIDCDLIQTNAEIIDSVTKLS
eukprot:336304_1